MRKFLCATVVTLAVAGVAAAAEVSVTAIIMRVEKKGEGDKVEYTVHYRTFPKKKGEKVDPVARPVARNCVIARGKVMGGDPAKKIEKGDAIENGLANELFPTKDSDKRPVVRITIDEDKGIITQILVLPLPGKKVGDGS
jgi:hypothetical protein